MEELDREAIDEVLSINGLGTLSLVDGDQPYGIPISFGYDERHPTLVMHWGTGYGGRKSEIIQSNPRASVSVYEHEPDPPRTWRSVIVSGQLRRVPDEQTERAYQALGANAEFAPDFGVWGVPLEDVDLVLMQLEIEQLSGRRLGLSQLS